jgi:hypothetical protein
MQQGMLFHAEYAGKSSEYLRRMSCVLKGDLDAEAFWAAWEHALRRHSVLRTGFVWEGTKEPVQVVYHDVVLPWKELDWSDLPAVQQQAQLERLIEADQELGFDLTQPPLTRCTMIRLAARRYQFIWTLHHILLDGWSVPLLLKEVFTSYEALCRHEALESDPPKPYRDFIVWLRQRDQRESEARSGEATSRASHRPHHWSLIERVQASNPCCMRSKRSPGRRTRRRSCGIPRAVFE